MHFKSALAFATGFLALSSALPTSNPINEKSNETTKFISERQTGPVNSANYNGIGVTTDNCGVTFKFLPHNKANVVINNIRAAFQLSHSDMVAEQGKTFSADLTFLLQSW